MSARVIVLGGGVAGMSAAHELIERGFEVVVLERRDIAGGKARSIPVADDGAGTSGHVLVDAGVASIEHHLPGEHGFRFFPGFYKHVVDTMRRIPSFDGRQVADHLVPTTRVGITQYEKPTFVIPRPVPAHAERCRHGAARHPARVRPDHGPHARRSRLLRRTHLADPHLLRGAADRRVRTDGAGGTSSAPSSGRASYQKFLAAGITRSLVAAKAGKASTRTIGDIFVQLMITIINPTAGSTDRVLDGPTNLVWIDPWLSLLESSGVRVSIQLRRSRRSSARVAVSPASPSGRTGSAAVVTGDYYVSAVPLERMATLLNDGLLAADPALANLRTLAPNVDWMNGVQYYLRRDVPDHARPRDPHRHRMGADEHLAAPVLASLAPERFGDSDVRGVLSVDVSDWTAPGSDGRTARQCSREEVVRETWRQLKRSINVDAGAAARRGPALVVPRCGHRQRPAHPGYLANAEPLLVNLVGTWPLRPDAATAIPNLFLASDYVQTYTDLATMEGANEAARRAVNGLLDAAGFDGPRCEPLAAAGARGPRAVEAARRRAIRARPARGTIPRPRWWRTCSAARRRCSTRCAPLLAAGRALRTPGRCARRATGDRRPHGLVPIRRGADDVPTRRRLRSPTGRRGVSSDRRLRRAPGLVSRAARPTRSTPPCRPGSRRSTCTRSCGLRRPGRARD